MCFKPTVKISVMILNNIPRFGNQKYPLMYNRVGFRKYSLKGGNNFACQELVTSAEEFKQFIIIF